MAATKRPVKKAPELPPKIEMTEWDITVHDQGQHKVPTEDLHPKSSAWYAAWGNKCPTCKVPPMFKQVPFEEAVDYYAGRLR